MKKQNRYTMLSIALLGATLSLAGCGAAESQEAAATPKEGGDITLQNCVIQESIPGAKATGAFLSIIKQSDKPLSLVSATAPSVTSHVELHEMLMKDGKMKMQQMKEYPLVKGENVFAKGGYHIMLMDLPKPVAIGEEHSLTLTFSDGSTESCTATVKSVASLKSKKNMQGKMHDMSH